MYQFFKLLFTISTTCIKEKPVSDVTFRVVASRHSQTLFDYTFQRNDGDLDLDIITTNQKEVTMKEESGGGWFGQIVGSPSNLAIISGPIFGRGGLYQFKVEVLSAGSNNLDPPITYNIGLSIPDTSLYTINNNGFEQNVKVITYYDQISDFKFNSQENKMRFLMPFDWSGKNLDQVTVVHQEISIPKSFGDFLSSKYYAYVNGIKLEDRSVVIDDYSKPERLIHIIVNQNDLVHLKNLADKQQMEFVLQPSSEKSLLLTYTKNSQYLLTLDYYPNPLVSGSDVSFLFDVKQTPQNKTVAASYDFSITQNGRVIFQKAGTTDDTVTTKIDVSIPDNVSGPVILQFENIGGNAYALANIPLVIKKSEKSQSSTVSLFSFNKIGNSTSKGRYQVDLDWTPSYLQVGKDSKFAFTIRDTSTSRPVFDTYYEFVILQNGKEKFRKAGIAINGSDDFDYVFGGQQGTYLVKIENIGKTGQEIEIPVTVTPEFPASLLMVLAVPISFILIMKKIKRV